MSNQTQAFERRPAALRKRYDNVMDEDDDFPDKALEGFALFALNKGEVCTCPSRALVQASAFDKFMEHAIKRVAGIRVGDPLETPPPHPFTFRRFA